MKFEILKTRGMDHESTLSGGIVSALRYPHTYLPRIYLPDAAASKSASLALAVRVLLHRPFW